MEFHPVELTPAAACAALRHRRKALRARTGALARVPDGDFARRFPALVAAVEAAFRHEEALLELLGDACLHPRRADHAVILCALHRTMARVEDGDVALGRQVTDALDAVLSLPGDPLLLRAAARPRPAPRPSPR